MSHRTPQTQLKTHQVVNQPPPLENYNLYQTDTPLREAILREGDDSIVPCINDFGATLGQEEMIHAGRLANTHPPKLKIFDRFGQRIDEVEFHPAYHQIMELGKKAGITGIAWQGKHTKGHVAHTALQYLLGQVEPGSCCPLCMTYAAIPVLRHDPALANDWEPKLSSPTYDPRSIPAGEKDGLTLGMAMTEKQGGSDIRTNTTQAEHITGNEYSLVGHKWFCSAPMSDAFLTLAQTKNGLSCFFVPRWRPDGTRNGIALQRLKDKLGNRSNASSEIEYHNAWSTRIGEEGRGVRTIIEMVHHTRLDCMLAASALMRQSLAQAVHHAEHRTTFGKTLIDHDLMRNVLADLALEVEGAVALTFRVARAYDDGATNPQAKLFSRLAVAIGKYWTNKRVIPFVGEAMECLGGAGYVEESPMPWLYREAPLNGIWEGSGNVICLDVLRAFQKEPESVSLVVDELKESQGVNQTFDRTLAVIQKELTNPNQLENRARFVTELLAKTLQASLLLQSAPGAIADAFCENRLGGSLTTAFGTLRDPSVYKTLIDRASPNQTN